MRTASQTTRGFTIEASHATLSSMRRVALGLLAAAGCNQIWGLGPVDLAPPGDGPGDGANVRRIRLTAQITKTTRMGYVDPSLDEGPITPAPLVQLGPIDGPLMSAAYGTDGTVAYPAGFLGKPWRLVYTLAAGRRSGRPHRRAAVRPRPAPAGAVRRRLLDHADGLAGAARADARVHDR